MDETQYRPTLLPADLVFSTRAQGRDGQNLGVRISRGVYLPENKFEGLTHHWQAEHLVAQARIFAEALRPGAYFENRAMTMSSALILHGIDTWVRNPPVTYRPAEAPGRMSLLPEVQTPLGSVEESVSRPLVFARRKVIPESRRRRARATATPATASEKTRKREVVLESLEQVALDIARRMPPLAATADVSKIFNHLVEFDRDQPGASRQREKTLRNALLEMNSSLPTRHRCRVAEAVLKAADAGVDSHAEGATVGPTQRCRLGPTQKVVWRRTYEPIQSPSRHRALLP